MTAMRTGNNYSGARWAYASRPAVRNPMPTVTYDGVTYKVRSRKTEIPDLDAMDRLGALMWLNRNTFARGVGIRTTPNPLQGMGGAISLTVR
jgi:hypothetical protein